MHSEIAGAKVHLFSLKQTLTKIFFIFIQFPILTSIFEKNEMVFAQVLIFCLALQPQ